MGVAKQQSDLKRSFSQIYQIDRSIFVDRSEGSGRVEKNAAIVYNIVRFFHSSRRPIPFNSEVEANVLNEVAYSSFAVGSNDCGIGLQLIIVLRFLPGWPNVVNPIFRRAGRVGLPACNRPAY